MPVRIIRKDALRETSRHVCNASYETFRFLLASDDLGVTVTDIVLAPGEEATYGYDNHVEIAYCIDGEALLQDASGGPEERILPGAMWIAGRGDRFRFRALVPTRLVCVFTPPFEGHETGFAGDQ